MKLSSPDTADKEPVMPCCMHGYLEPVMKKIFSFLEW